jgi:hypothetical protein
MSIELNGTTGITTPGLTNTGTETIVNLTTTGNTILGNASTDTLNVGNGDLIKDASGNVGIGVTPSYKLDVSIANATVYSTAESARFPSAAISRVANTNGTAGNYCINTMTVQGQSAYFGVVAGTSYTPDFVIGRTTASSSFVESMRIPTTGGIQSVNCVSVGNATPSASGAGITFPATQSASTNANTLDDYEEGTWTPTLGGTSSLSINSATYTKIGRVVNLETTFTVTSLGTGSSYIVTGLPFTPSNSTAMSVGFFSGISAAAVSVYSYLDAAGNWVVAPLTASGVTIIVSTAIFANSTIMRISGTIEV